MQPTLKGPEEQTGLRTVRPGWIEFDGQRVCVVDGVAGLSGLHRAYFDEVGVGASSFLYLAGLRATVAWTLKFACDSPELFLSRGLNQLEHNGFGAFEITNEVPAERRLRVVGRDSLEGWSHLRRHPASKTPVCSYTSGLLAGLWCLANDRCHRDAPNAVCWETTCIAAGADACRFEIGPADLLRKKGFSSPIRSPNLRWEYQEISRRLQSTDTRLETLHQQLAMRERAYQSLIDNMNDVLLVLSKNKRVMFCNRQFLRATGLTMEEALGSSPLERVLPEDRASVEKIYEDLLSGRIRSATYRFRVARPKGVVYMESSARAVTAPDGEPAIELLGRDVTERELAQRKLEEAHQALLRKQRIADHDLKVAKLVHESLLSKPVSRPEIDIDVKYVPADRVGGDYCHIAFPGDHHCLLTVCDVSGHGMASALLAARVSSFLRLAGESETDPFAVTRDLNTFLLDHFADTGLFVTFLAVSIDLRTFDMQYCGAGHPGPLLVRGDGEVEVLESQNLPVGVVREFGRKPYFASRKIESGDRLILYTDGVTESQNNDRQLLQISGLQQIVLEAAKRPLFEVGDWILQKVADFRGGGRPKDDMTLLLVEAKRPRR